MKMAVKNSVLVNSRDVGFVAQNLTLVLLN